MTQPASLDMNMNEFRQWGHHLIDWIADYLSHPERYPVLAQVKPGSIRSRLSPTAPVEPESMDAIVHDIEAAIVPGITHWNHPAFFAYFGSTGSGPGILGELLSAAFNANGMIWKTSPAGTELEEVVLDWLRQMLGLPGDFWGVVYDTASTSTFHALAAARQAIEERDVGEVGIAGPDAPRLRLYTSEQAHSSVDKAAIALGLGRSGVVRIPTDDLFRMKAGELEAAVDADRRQGWRPFCVSATVGTTSTTSIDPIVQIADVCQKNGLWLHVDAAYAGTAAILPEMRFVLDGCEQADSFVINPHKWMFTPVDFSALYCRRPNVLKQAFSVVPEYLKTAEGVAATNYMEYGIPLGRRFRALKLWMVIRYFGVRGLQARIREHLRLARLFASWVESSTDFELAAPVPFSTVCFRSTGDDASNQRLLDRVNASGKVFLSHTRLDGRLIIRFSVGNIRSMEEHVRMAWDVIRAHA